MRTRGIVRSLIASHRADVTRPDRGSFILQTRRWTAAPHLPGRLPQLQSVSPVFPDDSPLCPEGSPRFPEGIHRCPEGFHHFPKRFHRCPVPVIILNGNLIVAAGVKYPKVAARLPAGYLVETTTLLGKLPADITSQHQAKGETSNLTAAQQANFDSLMHYISQARATAKLAFNGQTVKLHQEFLMGAHTHRLSEVLSQADTILASVQLPANLPALKLKGWTDADTAAFIAVRGTFPASSNVQHSGQSDGMKATTAKATDAALAYEHLLTIQNAANLELPATNPANAPARAEFRLGIFPPTHHTPPTPPTPAPPTQTPPAK